MNSRVEAIEPRCPTNLFERTPTSEQLKNTHYSASYEPNRLSRLRAVATACQWPARCATSYGGLPSGRFSCKRTQDPSNFLQANAQSAREHSEECLQCGAEGQGGAAGEGADTDTGHRVRDGDPVE